MSFVHYVYKSSVMDYLCVRKVTNLVNFISVPGADLPALHIGHQLGLGVSVPKKGEFAKSNKIWIPYKNEQFGEI